MTTSGAVVLGRQAPEGGARLHRAIHRSTSSAATRSPGIAPPWLEWAAR